MKKSLLALSLLAAMSSMTTQASCLELYKEYNNSPSDEAVALSAISSTAGAVSIVAGVEGGLITSATLGAALAESDSAILDFILLDGGLDLLSSATEAVYYGTSSTLVATGLLDESKKNYAGQIKLLEEAQLAPNKIGSTLAEFTDDLNDRRGQDEKVSIEDVADELRVASDRGEFCSNENDMSSMAEIRNIIEASL